MCRSREITTRTIDCTFGGLKLHRAVYTQGCKSAAATICRARARVGEKNYSVFTNSARGFAYWCKTGRGGGCYDDWLAEQKYVRNHGARAANGQAEAAV